VISAPTVVNANLLAVHVEGEAVGQRVLVQTVLLADDDLATAFGDGSSAGNTRGPRWAGGARRPTLPQGREREWV